MATEEERCAEARKFQRIDAAFHKGDLDALRAAVDDADVVPNGPMPLTIGSCLLYAIYHSPLPFIRTLLDVGADPNAPADDLEGGADPELRTRIDACETPLEMATTAGLDAIAAMLTRQG